MKNLSDFSRQGITQLNANEILIFGGQHKNSYKESESTYIGVVSHDSTSVAIEKGTNLPRSVQPETPGYALNSHANFYFSDNICNVYRYSKYSR